MLRALLWKEWREQRAIAYAGALMALMIPAIVMASATASGAADLVAAADIVPFLSAMVVWPLFAALAGATSGVERSSSGSAAFLLSRPVGRGRLWLVKVTIALVSISFVVAVSFFASLQVSFWVVGWGFRFPFSSDPLSLPGDAVRAMALGGLLVTFTSAVWLSTFMRQALTALVAATAVGIGSQAIGLVVAGRIGGSGVAPGAGAFLAGYSGMVSAAILGASLYVFRVGGLLGSERGGRAMIRATAGVVAMLPLALALPGFSSTRITPDDALVLFRHAVPESDAVVVRLDRGGFAGTSLWVAAPDAPLRRLTARLTDAIAVSPDGEWLAYVSRRSAMGTRSSRCEIRAVRIDGSEDRRLLTIDSPGFCVGNGVFSPDSERLAVTVGSPHRVAPGLFVASLVGDSPRELDTSVIVAAWRNSSGYRLSWLSNDELLMTVVGSYVWRIDTGDGAIGKPYDEPAGAWARILARAGSLMLVREEYRSSTAAPDARIEAKLVDLADGSAREIEPLCTPTRGGAEEAGDGSGYFVNNGPVAALSNERQVLYACSRAPRLAGGLGIDDRPGPWESQVMRRDLVTGGEVLVATFEGRSGRLLPSPDGKRFLVHLWGAGGTASAGRRDGFLILDENGAQQGLHVGSEWRVEGWLGNRRLLLRKYQRTPHGATEPLAYLDIDEPSAPRPFHLSAGWWR